MSNASAGKRINPLSRRPRQQRLVVAVRGAAGTVIPAFRTCPL